MKPLLQTKLVSNQWIGYSPKTKDESLGIVAKNVGEKPSSWLLELLCLTRCDFDCVWSNVFEAKTSENRRKFQDFVLCFFIWLVGEMCLKERL